MEAAGNDTKCPTPVGPHIGVCIPVHISARQELLEYMQPFEIQLIAIRLCQRQGNINKTTVGT